MEGRTRRISRTGGGVALRALLALVLAIGLMPAIPATALADEPTAPAADSQEAVAKAVTDSGEVKYYDSLSEAIENVEVEGTVTLLKDSSGNGVVVESGKSFTLDLGGRTYTINGETVGSAGTETNGFQLLKDSTITIEDGTIASDKAKILIQNYSNLTLRNVNLIGGTNTEYTLSNNNGEILIDTGTNIKAGSASPQVAFDVCRYASYPSVKVTVASDAGKISGKIELSASDSDAKEGFSLSIEGGNLSDASLKIASGGNLASVEKSPNVELAAPEGSAWINGSLVKKNPGDTQQAVVATIGDVGYTTLSAAIAAASNGGTVVLVDNVTKSVTVDKGANVTIDLNGHKITNTDGSHTIVNNGTLTVNDSAGGGVVDNVTHGKAALWNEVGATATLNAGTFVRSRENGSNATDNGGNSYYAILNHGTMTINDGVSVVQEGNYSSLLENGWQNGSDNKTGEESWLTINGGTFTGGLNTIKNDDYGHIEINGGTFENTAQAAVLNWNVAVINEGTFNSKDRVVLNGHLNDTMDQGSLKITGGTFNPAEGSDIIQQMGGSKNAGNISISGGAFNGNLADESIGATSFVVTGGVIEASDENKKAIPYFIADGVVAKVDSGVLEIVGRGNLGAGEYIVADGAPAITAGDLADGLEVEYDKATGQWVVSKPALPVVPKPSYDVTVDQPANGTVELSSTTAKEGQKVTVTVTPDFGWELAQLTVADEDGDALELTENADGTYSFTMPAGDVTVHASFADAWENPFTDLGEDYWGYGAVRMANLLGLMKGYEGTTLFGPDDGLMREQAATVMWNLMGAGDVSRPEAPQADVDQSQWYAPYVNWAVDSKVMDGYSEDDFGVGDSLTREQFAAVVAKAVGADVDSADQAALGAFPDADGVSGWARATMAWAVEAGVLNGVETEDGSRELQSTRELTRAEMATMMVNAIEVGVLDFGA